MNAALSSDICIILEGCYPYVTGGVSSWIQTLMSNLGDFSFSIMIISPDEQRREAKYDYPENVVEVVETPIEAAAFNYRPKTRRDDEGSWQAIVDFHEQMAAGGEVELPSIFELLHGREKGPKIDVRAMLRDDGSFGVIRQLNERFGSLSPLLDYYHTWRATHFPIMHLLGARIPQASLYHSISTGYAGLVGALAKYRFNAPFLLTEHGIYTKEREMEVMRADWIAEQQRPFWLRYFNALGRLAYQSADQVIALFELNRQLQIELGADALKCRVIPNGISIEDFTAGARKEEDDVFRIGLIGRVAKIKDIKTFIKACALLARKHDRVEFFILGPWEEEPKYAKECKMLARDLSIDRQLVFTGKVDVRQWYCRLDCLVLSSVKEAQPLVLIEAMCAGVPTVATRVGGVPEIIEGCGQVVNVKSPSEMAQAIERYIQDEDFRYRSVQRGIERARKVFSLDGMIEAYRKLYRSFLCGKEGKDS